MVYLKIALTALIIGIFGVEGVKASEKDSVWEQIFGWTMICGFCVAGIYGIYSIWIYL